MKRVLVVGSSSFVGSNIARDLRDRYLVYGTHFNHAPRIEGVTSYRLPITSTAPIAQLVAHVRPHAVVYCAGLTNDECERNPEAASLVNSYGALYFAEALASTNGRLIFLSSSKVFEGDTGDYREEETPTPKGHYGISKLRGERNLLPHLNTVIFRLGTVVGLGSRNQTAAIVNRLVESLRQKKPTEFICDEYRSFLPVREISRAVEHALEAEQANAGTYHLAGASKGTYYDLAKALARAFHIPESQVHPVSGAKFKGEITAQFRGSDLSLDASLYSKTFRQRLMPLEEALTSLRDKMRDGTQ